jgi:hypothetical protein
MAVAGQIQQNSTTGRCKTDSVGRVFAQTTASACSDCGCGITPCCDSVCYACAGAYYVNWTGSFTGGSSTSGRFLNGHEISGESYGCNAPGCYFCGNYPRNAGSANWIYYNPPSTTYILTITGNPTGGSFTLKGTQYGANVGPGASIPWNEPPGITGGLPFATETFSVSLGSSPFTITVYGNSVFPTSALSLATNSLTGGTSPGVTITTASSASGYWGAYYDYDIYYSWDQFGGPGTVSSITVSSTVAALLSVGDFVNLYDENQVITQFNAATVTSITGSGSTRTIGFSTSVVWAWGLGISASTPIFTGQTNDTTPSLCSCGNSSSLTITNTGTAGGSISITPSGTMNPGGPDLAALVCQGDDTDRTAVLSFSVSGTGIVLNTGSVSAAGTNSLTLQASPIDYGTAQGVDIGTAGGGTPATITLQTGHTFGLNALAGDQISIASGTGAGQVQTILSNTNTNPVVVTIAGTWTTTPNTTSVYGIAFPSNDTITFPANHVFPTNALTNNYIYIGSGTGSGQWAQIVSNTNANPCVATISGTWATNPDPTSEFGMGLMVGPASGGGISVPSTFTENLFVGCQAVVLNGLSAGSTKQISTSGPSNPMVLEYYGGGSLIGGLIAIQYAQSFNPTNATGAQSADVLTGYTVSITSGTGSGQSAAIISNSAEGLSSGGMVLGISPPWTTLPDTTSVYAISPDGTFTGTVENAFDGNSQVPANGSVFWKMTVEDLTTYFSSPNYYWEIELEISLYTGGGNFLVDNGYAKGGSSNTITLGPGRSFPTNALVGFYVSANSQTLEITGSTNAIPTVITTASNFSTAPTLGTEYTIRIESSLSFMFNTVQSTIGCVDPVGTYPLPTPSSETSGGATCTMISVSVGP